MTVRIGYSNISSMCRLMHILYTVKVICLLERYGDAMVNVVVKRDGRKEPFSKDKIVNAIGKAFTSVDGDMRPESLIIAENIAEAIKYDEHSELSVEDIQDIVENKLMQSSRKDVAKSYIIYRNERTKIREHNSAFTKSIGEKLYARNVENQNANVDERSFGGRVGAAASEMTKKYALDYIVSDMARNNHLNNEIYIHDLDSYAVGNHNCLSIPFDDLLAKGFNTRQTDVRPAQSVNTAFQLVAVIFQLQSLQQFGGVSATHLDHTMVPYVRKSYYKHLRGGFGYMGYPKELELFNSRYNDIKNETKLRIDGMNWDDYFNFELPPIVQKYALDQTEKETYQAVEGMYHNLSY